MDPMSKHLAELIHGNMCKHASKHVSEHMSARMSERMPEHVSDHMSEHISRHLKRSDGGRSVPPERIFHQEKRVFQRMIGTTPLKEMSRHIRKETFKQGRVV